MISRLTYTEEDCASWALTPNVELTDKSLELTSKKSAQKNCSSLKQSRFYCCNI